MKHSAAKIFVCPERIFKINDNKTIPKQPCFIDYWDEKGCCTYCGKKKEDINNEED